MKTSSGINRLPLFTAHAQKLIVIFDVMYATRMWCVFELAVFLRTRDDPQIEFASIDVKLMELITIVVVLMVELAMAVFSDYQEANAVMAVLGLRPERGYTNTEARDAYLPVVWMMFVVLIFITIVVYILGERHFHALDELHTTVLTYDINNAQLAAESDRDFLLKIIDELFDDEPRAEHSSVDELINDGNMAVGNDDGNYVAGHVIDANVTGVSGSVVEAEVIGASSQENYVSSQESVEPADFLFAQVEGEQQHADVFDGQDFDVEGVERAGVGEPIVETGADQRASNSTFQDRMRLYVGGASSQSETNLDGPNANLGEVRQRDSNDVGELRQRDSGVVDDIEQVRRSESGTMFVEQIRRSESGTVLGKHLHQLHQLRQRDSNASAFNASAVLADDVAVEHVGRNDSGTCHSITANFEEFRQPDSGFSPHQMRQRDSDATAIVVDDVELVLDATGADDDEDLLPETRNDEEGGEPGNSNSEPALRRTFTHSKGIASFNHTVQTLVPQQLPLTGARSWKLFGYLTAVLVFGTLEILEFLDMWAWKVDYNSPVGNIYNADLGNYGFSDDEFMGIRKLKMLATGDSFGS